MVYTVLTKKAMRIAFDKHKEQVDNNGLPYIFHPFHLAEQMETEKEVCVALLHDVMEDSDTTVEELRSHGFPDSVIDALTILMHNDGTEYMDYIMKIKSNSLAMKVKIADLRHNMNLSRNDSPSEFDLQRHMKYDKAISILLNIPERETDEHPLDREYIPLDNKRLWFLSIFRNKVNDIVKYSFDVEKADDSHYELRASEYDKLAAYFGGKETIEALKDFINNHNEHEFTTLLDKLEIYYRSFHYY